MSSSDKSTLTVPNHLFHVMENDFQEDLLHHFPGDWYEDDCPGVQFSFSILKMIVTFLFFKSSGISPDPRNLLCWFWLGSS